MKTENKFLLSNLSIIIIYFHFFFEFLLLLSKYLFFNTFIIWFVRYKFSYEAWMKLQISKGQHITKKNYDAIQANNN